MTKAARSRGFPEALREQIAAWDQLRSGCRSAHDLIRDVHAWLASQPADETAALRADIRELQRNALPSNCTRCNGLGAEPPGCPESGPCERCGGWTPHKLLVAGEAESLRAELAASREHTNRLASSLLMIASEVDGDPKIDYRDYLDPRYTPALRQVGELRRDVEALRARVRELESDVEARTRATNRSLDRYREESDALRAVDSRTRAKIEESGYQRGIEEAFRVVCEEAPCIARVRDESGDWTDAIGRRETYLAIRALADRGAK